MASSLNVHDQSITEIKPRQSTTHLSQTIFPPSRDSDPAITYYGEPLLSASVPRKTIH